MKTLKAAGKLLFGASLLLSLATISYSQVSKDRKTADQKEKAMTKLAKGTFEVKMTPIAADEAVGDPAIGRLGMVKQFAGELDGTSKGQMLGSQSETVKGSGGYVAMESFTGTLNGKKGGFILQHIGTMQGDKFELNVSVVPDSGSGELTGISGRMKIIIEGSKHMYEFDYSLPQGK